MRKRNKLIGLLIGFAFVLNACVPSAAPATETVPAPLEPTQVMVLPEASPTAVEEVQSTIIVEDALGQSITFEQAPQRIVQAGRSGLMIIDAAYAFPEAQKVLLALSEVTQGRGNFGEVIDPAFSDKILIGRDTGVEPIVAMNPDVVVMKSFLAADFGKPIQDLGVPVVYLDLETPEQYQRDLTTLGQLFNNPQRAEELKQYYQSKTEFVTSRTQSLTEEQKPKVLMLYYSSQDGQTALSVPPLSWIQTTLVQNAGGTPLWQDIELGKGWTKVNFEQIAAWDADKIFIIAYNENVLDVTANFQEDPQWQALRAVKDGQLFGVPGDYYSWDQPDTRWILGQLWLAAKIQPELFADMDIMEETSNFFNTLYGMDEAAFTEKIVPLLSGDVE
jgi:iron complex transport system substrate-binding protein